MRNPKALSSNEKRRIRRLHDSGHDNTAIAGRINRGRTTVRRYLESIGRSSASDRYLSEEDDALIQYLNSQGLNFQQIADVMDLHRCTIDRNKGRLNLVVIGNNELSIERQKESYRRTMQAETMGTNSYSERNNRLRAASIGWEGRNLNQALILYVLAMDGELETPKIIDRVVAEKKARDWKPASMVRRTFYDHVNIVKGEGLVYVTYRGNIPAVYGLTDDAQDQFKKRVKNRIDYDRLERVLAGDN